jgi:hypothetical protein
MESPLHPLARTCGELTATVVLGIAGTAQLGLTPKISASDGKSADGFGNSVSVLGERMLVGAPGVDGTMPSEFVLGAAYVYERGPSGWIEVQKLAAPIGGASYRFGASVALDGQRAFVGAPKDGPMPGTPYVAVFVHDGTAFQLEAILQAPAPDPSTLFGRVLAADGDRVLVGTNNEQAAYVYERAASAWLLSNALIAPESIVSAGFGASVALSGEWALVGAPNKFTAGSPIGAVYAYRHVSGGWQYDAKWTSPAAGPPYFGSSDFGTAVALAGNLAIVSESSLGLVHGYAYAGGAWMHEQAIDSAGTPLGGVSGRELVLRGERAMIGPRLFQRFHGLWTCLGKLYDDAFGSQLPVLGFDGERVALGRPLVDDVKGDARVFEDLEATQLATRVRLPLVVGWGALQLTDIGGIAATAEPASRVDLRFTLAPAHASLDDCYDFRWVTVELTSKVDGVAQVDDLVLGLLPAITPPASIDAQPFFSTASEWAAGVSGGIAIRKERSFSLYFDEPQLPPTPAIVRRFHTQLVAVDAAATTIGPQAFAALAGFAWEYDSATHTSRLCGPIEEGQSLIAQAIWDGLQGCPGSAGCPGFASWSSVSLAAVPKCAVLGPPSGKTSISGSSGIVLQVEASALHAGKPYLVLGSASGTSPGIALGPYTLPLASDAYFDYTLSAPNHPPLSGSFGLLNSSGSAIGAFKLPVSVDPALAGLVVKHAVVVLDATLELVVASSPITISITP